MQPKGLASLWMHEAELPSVIDRERINELERERNIEREREWNKRHPKLPRPSSSLSVHSLTERTRTHSNPTRPDSAHSLLSPDHAGLHRHHSFSSNRAGSPTSSLSSRGSEKEQEQEVQHEVVHERERNWNSPHPKWQQPGQRGRSVSPLPHSPSPSLSASHHHSHSRPHVRARAESFKTPSTREESPKHHTNSGKQSLRTSTSHSSLHVKENTALSKAEAASSSSSIGKHASLHLNRADNHSSRPHSPLPPVHGRENETSGHSAASGSRFGWHFPRSRVPLPPLELDQENPGRPESPKHMRTPSSPTPSSRPSSRASETTRPSHIPVWSPKKLPDPPSPSTRQKGHGEERKGHKRSTTEFAESVGGIPPRLDVELAPFTFEDTHHERSVSGMSQVIIFA